jgi:TrmH family RNA methyltransferase
MDWKVIDSRQNPAVKLAASLGDKKARDQEGLFAAEGTTLFFDLARRGITPKSVYLSQKAIFLQEKVEKILEGKDCSCYLLSPTAFEKVTTEKGSEGILSLYSRRELESALSITRWEKLVALENLQDPGNVGTVIRTAAAFGIDGVLLVGCSDPFGPKAVRASMGAIGHIPIKVYSTSDELLGELEKNQVRSVAACLESDSVSIGKADLSGRVCVFIGNEGKGLQKETIARADQKVIIPISGMESLNAAIAAGVFLWEMVKERETE